MWWCVGLAFGAAPSSDTSVQLASFEHVWNRVGETYPYEDMSGVDWDGVRASLLPRAKGARTNAELRAVLTYMFDALGDSHFAVIDSTEDWGTAHETRGSESPGTGGWWTTGVKLGIADGCLAVRRVSITSPDMALRPGDCLTAIEGRSTAIAKTLPGLGVQLLVRSLRGDPDGRLRVTVDRDGEVLQLDLQAQPWADAVTEPVGFVPSGPFEARVDTKTVGSAPITVLGFGSFDLALMPYALRAVDEARRRASVGMVIDLRGNTGGLLRAAQGLAGFFVDEPHSMGTIVQRAFSLELRVHPRPADQAFRGPVAILIDEASASSSEVLASGLQPLPHVRVFGRPSAGAVMASSFERMPNGDLVQLAFGDLLTPLGERLEGRGVVPDVPVVPTRAQWRAGIDPTLNAALDWLAEAARIREASSGEQ